MRKDVVRREFLKLKLNGHSYAECQALLKEHYEAEFCTRTLKEWWKKFNKSDWNLEVSPFVWTVF